MCTPNSAPSNAIANVRPKEERTSRSHSLATFYSSLETHGLTQPPAARDVLALQLAEMGPTRGPVASAQSWDRLPRSSAPRRDGASSRELVPGSLEFDDPVRSLSAPTHPAAPGDPHSTLPMAFVSPPFLVSFTVVPALDWRIRPEPKHFLATLHHLPKNDLLLSLWICRRL